MKLKTKFETYRDFVYRYSNQKTADREVIQILRTLLFDWESNIITKEMNNGK